MVELASDAADEHDVSLGSWSLHLIAVRVDGLTYCRRRTTTNKGH